MPKDTNYDLIIFDWDGTLSDSAGAIINSIKDASIKNNIEIPPEKSMRSIIGLGLDEAFEKLFPDHLSHYLDSLKIDFREFYLNYVDDIAIFDGVDVGIKMLFNQGFKLAVATGKSRRGLNNALNKTNLNAFFSFTRTMDECFSKPHPQMINEILENLFIEPERAIMVGDSIYDLEMARNANIDSIAVTYGSQTHDELNHYPTKVLIDNPHDLFDWLRVHG